MAREWRRFEVREVDYRALADWRGALRRFLRESARITEAGGISPTQYQLLLFIRGSGENPPTVADLAKRLQVSHNSAVGLIDRCEKAGLVERRRDHCDRRRVFVRTTRRGARLLRRLAVQHLTTIEALGHAFAPSFLVRTVRRGRRGGSG